MMNDKFCKSVEQKKELNETFLSTILEIKNMHRINKEKYQSKSDLCYCRYMIADHYLSVIESMLIGLLSELLVCAEDCFGDMCDKEDILADVEMTYDDIYKTLFYCSAVSTRFVRVFQKIMKTIDHHFIDKLLVAVAALIDDAENLKQHLDELLQVIIDYVDFFLLSLYGLVLDCGLITGDDPLPKQCTNGQEFCPIHAHVALHPRVTIFPLDDLIDYSFTYLQDLVNTLKDNYKALNELDLIFDFRFITKNNEVDLKTLSKQIEDIKNTFKSITFRNMNLNIPCLKQLVDHEYVRDFVVID